MLTIKVVANTLSDKSVTHDVVMIEDGRLVLRIPATGWTEASNMANDLFATITANSTTIASLEI